MTEEEIEKRVIEIAGFQNFEDFDDFVGDGATFKDYLSDCEKCYRQGRIDVMKEVIDFINKTNKSGLPDKKINSKKQ